MKLRLFGKKPAPPPEPPASGPAPRSVPHHHRPAGVLETHLIHLGHGPLLAPKPGPRQEDAPDETPDKKTLRRIRRQQKKRAAERRRSAARQRRADAKKERSARKAETMQRRATSGRSGAQPGSGQQLLEKAGAARRHAEEAERKRVEHERREAEKRLAAERKRVEHERREAERRLAAEQKASLARQKAIKRDDATEAKEDRAARKAANKTRAAEQKAALARQKAEERSRASEAAAAEKERLRKARSAERARAAEEKVAARARQEEERRLEEERSAAFRENRIQADIAVRRHRLLNLRDERSARAAAREAARITRQAVRTSRRAHQLAAAEERRRRNSATNRLREPFAPSELEEVSAIAVLDPETSVETAYESEVAPEEAFSPLAVPDEVVSFEAPAPLASKKPGEPRLRSLRATNPVLWEVLASVAQVAFLLAVLLPAFGLYELWGTTVTASHNQRSLLASFTKDLHHPRLGALRGLLPPPDGHQPAPGSPLAQIGIPAIDASFIVVEGVSSSDMRLGPGHYPGTALPGQTGNVAIAGHRVTYLHPFYYLNELTPGDVVELTTPYHTVKYRVTSVGVVPPTDTSILAPTRDSRLTLTTADPLYHWSSRIVVVAELATVDGVGVPSSPHGSARSTAGDSSYLAGRGASGLPALSWGLLLLALNIGTRLVARRSRQVVMVYKVAIPVMVLVGIVLIGAVNAALPPTI